MRKTPIFFLVFAIFIGAAWFLWPYFAPFRNSLPGRENEPGLPRVTIEKDIIVYCRMRADDFRFPLPAAARAREPVLDSGGFDTVNGSVEVDWPEADNHSKERYATALQSKMPVGGRADVGFTDSGLIVKFSYFGDR